MKTLLAALLASILVVPAMAQEEVEITPEDFAINNAYSALYHEFGHLFVDQFQLPILGNEEYVADAMATLMILQEQSDEALAISYDTVDGYLRSAEIFGAEKMEDVDFNDEHGMDQQRAAQMTCLLVGGDPDNYADLADQMGLEQERQDNCGAEYEQASRGWESLMADHVRGSKPEGAKLTVVYEPATKDYEGMEKLLKDAKVLEKVAETVTKSFVLARPATLRAAICDEENAFYNPEDDSVTMCYEYAKLYYDLIADPENAGAAFMTE